jgi:hypothetical protein
MSFEHVFRVELAVRMTPFDELGLSRSDREGGAVSSPAGQRLSAMHRWLAHTNNHEFSAIQRIAERASVADVDAWGARVLATVHTRGVTAADVVVAARLSAVGLESIRESSTHRMPAGDFRRLAAEVAHRELPMVAQSDRPRATNSAAGLAANRASNAFLGVGSKARATSGNKVPGQPAATWGLDTARYIKTADIDESLLPAEAKPTEEFQKPRLPSGWGEVPVVNVRLTKTHLVSSVSSGSNSRVVLGRLNGQPVAVKQHLPLDDSTPQEASAWLLTEVRSAKLMSDLGIGPHFYGITTPRGEPPGIVTDVVPGDFPDAVGTGGKSSIVLQTFKDLDVVLDRLRGAGIVVSWAGLDLQYYVTPRGRISVIDPGEASRGTEGVIPVDPDAQDDGSTDERIQLLKHAPTDVGIAYIRTLRQGNPVAYLNLKAVMVESSRNERSILFRYRAEFTAEP